VFVIFHNSELKTGYDAITGESDDIGSDICFALYGNQNTKHVIEFFERCSFLP